MLGWGRASITGTGASSRKRCFAFLDALLMCEYEDMSTPLTLPPIAACRKTGLERFQAEGADAGFNLLDFWQWSVSDLVSNATRGILAEYIVARALGLGTGIRNEWDAFDLRTPSGLKIEVKSAAYLQSWFQKNFSPIVFVIPPTRAFDAATNVLSAVSKRQADVYVFALLSHRDKETVDPMNLDQWEFYVVGVSALNDRQRSQHSITLKSLQLLCPVPFRFAGLAAAISKVGGDAPVAGGAGV